MIGKRPLSSSAPILALKDGKVVLSAGASGGTRVSMGTEKGF